MKYIDKPMPGSSYWKSESDIISPHRLIVTKVDKIDHRRIFIKSEV